MTESWDPARIVPRSRVIIDNEYCGDPDSVVQIAHHLLSPSVSIPFVVSSAVGTHHPEWSDHCVTDGVTVVRDVARLAGREDLVVLEGSNFPMEDRATPALSPAVDALITEALRDDTDLPLFIACGGGLTTLASAYLLEPRIADRVVLVWLGGIPYDMAPEDLPEDVRYRETNVMTDIVSAQVVFNDSTIPIWQMPNGVFSQALMSRAEAWSRVRPQGPLGRYVFDAIGARVDAWSQGLRMGETYGLGDQTLVALTALGGPYSTEPYTSTWEPQERPTLQSTGLYGPPRPGAGTIRRYTSIDVRLLFEDFYGKLAEFEERRSLSGAKE